MKTAKRNKRGKTWLFKKFIGVYISFMKGGKHNRDVEIIIIISKC
jgi:hypothetical protein